MSTTPTETLPVTHTVKIVFLGDAGIGKSNLITTYTSNYYTGQYIESVEDTYTKTVKLANNVSVQLIIHDLGGSVNHDRLYPLFLGAQGNIDVFVLCFMLGDNNSLLNVETKWKDLVDHVGKDVPIIVAGLRSDMRIKLVDVKGMKARVGASDYLECSALENIGVEKVFTEAIKLAQATREKKQLEVAVKSGWIGKISMGKWKGKAEV